MKRNTVIVNPVTGENELHANTILGGAFDAKGNPIGLVGISSKPDREFIDANADGYTYFGSAPFGSALADAVWTVERMNAAKTEFMYAPANSVGTDPTALTYNNGVA